MSHRRDPQDLARPNLRCRARLSADLKEEVIVKGKN